MAAERLAIAVCPESHGLGVLVHGAPLRPCAPHEVRAAVRSRARDVGAPHIEARAPLAPRKADEAAVARTRG